MALKRYLVFSLLFVLVVALYLFSFVSGDYTLDITPIHFQLTLPIAFWITALLLFLVFVSAFHMFYYSTKNFFQLRRIKADHDVFLKALRSAMLQENKKFKYKSEYFKIPGEILSSVTFKVANGFFSSDESFVKIASNIKEIQNGNPVDLSEYKLQADNPLVLENDLNSLKQDGKYAEKILKKKSDANSSLAKEAFKIYASYASLEDVLRVDMPVDKEVFFILLGRFVSKDNAIVLNKEKIDAFISSIKLDENDFLKVAKQLKKVLQPDELINMFEEFFDKYSESASAYIYILFELQMLDKVSEVLQNSSEDEFKKYKYLFELRESGKSFDIDLFV